MLKRHQRGQSTLEYVLLATAVIGVMITLIASNKSVFKETLNSTLDTSVTQMGSMVDRLNQVVTGTK